MTVKTCLILYKKKKKEKDFFFKILNKLISVKFVEFNESTKGGVS
jgi:hypothetical protein